MMWEPPPWDAFSKVNVKNIAPEEYEDEEELERQRKKKETALVEAKPTTMSGWDPETKTQSILTEKQMERTHRTRGVHSCRELVPLTFFVRAFWQRALAWGRWTWIGTR